MEGGDRDTRANERMLDDYCVEAAGARDEEASAPCRAPRLGRLAPCAGLLLLAGASALYVMKQRTEGTGVDLGSGRATQAFIVEAPAAPPMRCGRVEHDVEFLGTEARTVKDVAGPYLCCAMCQETAPCRAWTFDGQATKGTCTLLAVDPKAQKLTKRERKGIVSGVPFTWDKEGSLYCFALMQPRSYEQDLLQLQLRNHWSIFACDEYEVVTNESIRLSPGVVTTAIKSDLKCELGGEFGTALNTGIFLQVWDKVVENWRWAYNDWTVKADPDTAFFPQRLQVVLAFHPEEGSTGLYFNNCEYGLHGPLEILSRQAVMRWHSGVDGCAQHFNKLCSGPCLWGEDMFIDQCLQKVLHVKRVSDWNLISEPHCKSKDWEDCETQHVAFHPFKTTGAYTKCFKRAKFGALPFPT